MSPNALNMTMEQYRHETHGEGNSKKLAEGNELPHEPHYGIAFFEYLRSNLDLTKVDFGSLQGTSNLPMNFHSLRTLAVTKPWSFVKAVEELKKSSPNGTLFSSYQPTVSTGSNPGDAEFMHFQNVFNVMKKQQPSQM